MPSDPDYYCPICGLVLAVNHRCSQRTLTAIDAAHKRCPEEEETPKTPRWVRLVNGLKQMEQDGAFD